MATQQTAPSLNDGQKLDQINERLRKIQRNSTIQVIFILAGFIGIISLGALIQKGKKIVKNTL